MRLTLSLAALAVLAWLARRPASPVSDDDDYMAGIQVDPWSQALADTPYGRSTRAALDEGIAQVARGETVPFDPTYLEAQAIAAIRRTTQSSELTTEGMS